MQQEISGMKWVHMKWNDKRNVLETEQKSLENDTNQKQWSYCKMITRLEESMIYNRKDFRWKKYNLTAFLYGK